MIDDLISIIQNHSKDKTEILLFININEEYIEGYDIQQIEHQTKMIISIMIRYGLDNNLSTHKRGPYRIDYCLCTLGQDKF